MKGGKVGIQAMFDLFFSPKRNSKGSSHIVGLTKEYMSSIGLQT